MFPLWNDYGSLHEFLWNELLYFECFEEVLELLYVDEKTPELWE
jgi:hypothetical protein